MDQRLVGAKERCVRRREKYHENFARLQVSTIRKFVAIVSCPYRGNCAGGARIVQNPHGSPSFIFLVFAIIITIPPVDKDLGLNSSSSSSLPILSVPKIIIPVDTARPERKIYRVKSIYFWRKVRPVCLKKARFTQMERYLSHSNGISILSRLSL